MLFNRRRNKPSTSVINEQSRRNLERGWGCRIYTDQFSFEVGSMCQKLVKKQDSPFFFILRNPLGKTNTSPNCNVYFITLPNRLGFHPKSESSWQPIKIEHENPKISSASPIPTIRFQRYPRDPDQGSRPLAALGSSQLDLASFNTKGLQ